MQNRKICENGIVKDAAGGKHLQKPQKKYLDGNFKKSFNELAKIMQKQKPTTPKTKHLA